VTFTGGGGAKWLTGEATMGAGGGALFSPMLIVWFVGEETSSEYKLRMVC
jgi:hypothetical protein